MRKEGVSVSMVQVLGSAQATDKVVTIATIVAGTLDLGQMGHLVKNSGLLVLGVAGTASGRETREEERAVDHLAGGRVCVSEHAV